MLALPLQLFNDIVANYNFGDVLLLVAILGAIVTLVQRSNKLFGLHLLSMGLLFVILPVGMLEPEPGSLLGTAEMYKFVGLALMVLAPIIYTVSRR